MEIQTAEGLYRTKGKASSPYLLDLALQQIVHPLAEIKDGVPSLHKKVFGNTTLDCIMLGKSIKNTDSPPLGLFPTYCFDVDSGRDALRASFSIGSQFILRNNSSSFHDHEISASLGMSENSVTTMTAHVENFRRLTYRLPNFPLLPVWRGSNLMHRLPKSSQTATY